MLGTIVLGLRSLKELMPLLAELGKEPKTVIQRDKLTTLLAEVLSHADLPGGNLCKR